MTTAQAFEALVSLQWGRLLDLPPIDLLAFLVIAALAGGMGMTALVWLFVLGWNFLLKLQK